jgi:hypothetical protein
MLLTSDYRQMIRMLLSGFAALRAADHPVRSGNKVRERSNFKIQRHAYGYSSKKSSSMEATGPGNQGANFLFRPSFLSAIKPSSTHFKQIRPVSLTGFRLVIASDHFK